MLFNCSINNGKAPGHLISHYDIPLACVCAYVDTLVYVCLCVCLCVYVYRCMCLWVCTCMCVFVCVCICAWVYICMYVCMCMCVYMSPDFGKPIKLSHLILREILILNIQSTVVPLCYIVGMPDILYNWNSHLASVL